MSFDTLLKGGVLPDGRTADIGIRGGRIAAMHPLGPVFHGAGVNITVASNDGKLHVGVIACRESMPDVDALVRHFPLELARLCDAVKDLEATATPIRSARSTRARKK